MVFSEIADEKVGALDWEKAKNRWDGYDHIVVYGIVVQVKNLDCDD